MEKDYTLVRRRGQRTLRMHIDANGNIIVSAPYGVSQSQIDSFILANASWIEKAKAKVARYSYVSGSTIPFLGEQRTINVLQGKNAQHGMVDGIIYIITTKEDTESVKKEIKKLYVETVRSYMEKYSETWCKTMGLEMPSLSVNRAHSRWGVCYYDRKAIGLSYMCAILPEDLIDMIVLHELCHLRVHGHGERFWNLMERYMPDLEERKTRLKQLSKAGLAYNLV